MHDEEVARVEPLSSTSALGSTAKYLNKLPPTTATEE